MRRVRWREGVGKGYAIWERARTREEKRGRNRRLREGREGRWRGEGRRIEVREANGLK